MGAKVPKHADCPPCPECGLRDGTPSEQSSRGTEVPGTLWCPACGHYWFGTEADVAKAQRAWAAWERRLAREERDMEKQNKAAEDLQKYREAMARKKEG